MFTFNVVAVVSVSLEVSGGLFVNCTVVPNFSVVFYTVCRYVLASCTWPVVLRWP